MSMIPKNAKNEEIKQIIVNLERLLSQLKATVNDPQSIKQEEDEDWKWLREFSGSD